MSKTQTNYTKKFLTTWGVKPLKQFHIIISKSKEIKIVGSKTQKNTMSTVNSLTSVPNLSQVVKYSEVRVPNPQGLCLYLD